jgi:manganese oxidase
MLSPMRALSGNRLNFGHPWFGAIVGLGTYLALAAGLVLHLRHAGVHEAGELSPTMHWWRDSLLAVPMAVLVLVVAIPVVRWLLKVVWVSDTSPLAHAMWATAVGVGYALATVPGNWVHHQLFVGEHDHHAGSFWAHALRDASAVTWPTIAFALSASVLIGLPWQWQWERRRQRRQRPTGAWRSRLDFALARNLLAAGLIAAPVLVMTPVVRPASVAVVEQAALDNFRCGMWDGTRTVTADVVALDQEIVYNRLGVVNPYGMIYALRNDVVDKTTGLSEAEGGTLSPGNVMLRPDKRPRPLTLRANVGDCLQINFQNLLSQTAQPGQPADRNAGIHVNGLQVVDGIQSDGSFVGRNPSSLVGPGDSTTYTLFAEYENTYLLYNMGATVGAEAGGGSIGHGFFGAVNVEPFGTDWYRSQLTRVEMDLAAATGAATGQQAVGADGALEVNLTPDGHPVMDYEARYPVDPGHPFYDAAKAGRPIVNMLDGTATVHSDLNAVIAGKASDGYLIQPQAYPLAYWDNQVYNEYAYRGQEPFREYTVIFHDEIRVLQAFPDFFDDPVLGHTLHGVRDGFAINYGTGGIGSEIIANRLGVGPERECVECKYEEFFLTSWAVGDPAMIVDLPANQAGVDADGNYVGATKALYPDDPSNVHHGYLNDRVKFRNLHAGPKEHHIFHLHAQQWMMDWNTEKSGYLDSQQIGPGGGFTYEIAYGGSGNRIQSPGDAIFHCHFYPHFAQGMWELWRIHDTFERGTVLDPTTITPGLAGDLGAPNDGARALPDGEIAAGTPIPAVVPLPSRPMAPMPDPNATVAPDGASAQVDVDADGTADFRQDSDGDGKAWDAMPASNPGYPFWIPGVAGHRPPTPPMDLAVDGGLERHVLLAGDIAPTQFQTRLDFNKELITARLSYVPEGGTPAEQLAMNFHAGQIPDPAAPEGLSPPGPIPTFVSTGNPAADPVPSTFKVNGQPAVPGAPYADPCRTDDGQRITDPLKTYQGAVIELPVDLNKDGWHFQQQRILSLNGDVEATLGRARAPEPLVMRLNAGDCANFEHTNLTPNTYELDDFQVKTPTDVIGQHIHLVKFDVTSSDGSANGFNYEDGTLSPQEVEERIHAVRHQEQEDFANGVTDAVDCAALNGLDGDGRLNNGETQSLDCPLAEEHPYFGKVLRNLVAQGVYDPADEHAQLAWGARTTIQRWWADPVLNNSWDGGVGSVFTHDHFGPSTHQQVGLYATVLVEPQGTAWLHNETAALMGGAAGQVRPDGGPTSWQAMIVDDERGGPPVLPGFEAHREFYFEFADFQHAYLPGGGQPKLVSNEDPLHPQQIVSYADFPNAVNPSVREVPAPSPNEADLYFFPPDCPGGVPRPCPEAISADDPGTYVLNYRNEPIGSRVYDPATRAQASGEAGDLAYAFASIPRANPALNSQPGTYPPLTADVGPYDPYTPMIRAYQGDKVRVRIQVGAHEESHQFTIHGTKWLQEPLNPISGWRNSIGVGISEYMVFEAPVVPDTDNGSAAKIDSIYAIQDVEGLWNGAWGLFRSYGTKRADLAPVPGSMMAPVADKGRLVIDNIGDYDGDCPATAPQRKYQVAAVRAVDVLGPDGVVYNDRPTSLTIVDDLGNPTGPVTPPFTLHDPDALMYVMLDDVVFAGPGQYENPVGLKPGTPVEPIVLRARAGECVKAELWNLLPVDEALADTPGYNLLPGIIKKNEVDGGIVTFNSNDVSPSKVVGMIPQLVSRNLRTSAARPVGSNSHNPNVPGLNAKALYTWYAGDTRAEPTGVAGHVELVSRAIEFGTANLMPADPIEQPSKGMIGTLVIEPPDADWVTDPGTRVSATVTFNGGTTEFREFVTVLQNDVNMRYGGCAPPAGLDPASDAAQLACAVPNLKEADDAEDSGSKAINYGADPLWFRMGISPQTNFSVMRDNTDAHRVFSNDIVGGADPQTAVFTVSPMKDQSVRMRLAMPAGHGRAIEFTTHGHPWQRQPHVDGSDRISWTFHDDPTVLNTADEMVGGRHSGEMPGHNMVGWWISSQEGVSASSHWDLNMRAGGGRDRVQGDFLFRDYASFGSLSGLWGIIRHGTSDAIGTADVYEVRRGGVQVIDAEHGLVANDHDLDGDAITVVDVDLTGTTGNVTVNSDGSFTYQPGANAGSVDSFKYTVDGSTWVDVTVQVVGPNKAPLTVDDDVVTHPGTPVTIAVLANDTDQDGDTLTLASVGPVAKVGEPPAAVGTAEVVDGKVKFTPAAGFTGTTSFPYLATDGNGWPVLGTVHVTIVAPDAVDDTATTPHGTAATIDVLANDVVGSLLKILSVDLTSTGGGTAQVVNGKVEFTPAAGFTGSDTFTYTVATAGAPSTAADTATVTVNVTDVVTINKAEYTKKTKKWTVSGSVDPKTAGVTVTASYNGQRIGATTTSSTGAFSLSVSPSSVVPACGRGSTPGTLRVTSTRGGVAEITTYVCR